MMKQLLLLVFALAALAFPAWGGGLLIGSGVGTAEKSWQIAFIDTFTETTDTYLPDHNALWIDDDNVVRPYVRASVDDLKYVSADTRYHLNMTLSNDQSASVKLVEGDPQGVYVRYTSISNATDDYTGYVAWVELWNNRVRVAGRQNATTAYFLYNFDYTYSYGDILELSAVGDKIRVYINGTQIGTDITDSHIAGGFCGLRGAANGVIDDFTIKEYK